MSENLSELAYWAKALLDDLYSSGVVNGCEVPFRSGRYRLDFLAMQAAFARE